MTDNRVDAVVYWRSHGAWYADALDEDGESIMDSQKLWFPVDVDRFRASEKRLRAALAAAFPGAEILSHYQAFGVWA